MAKASINTQRKLFPVQWKAQTHGTAMGTWTAVSIATFFKAHIETAILSKTVFNPIIWRRHIDDNFALGT